jgi:hypothetical protein
LYGSIRHQLSEINPESLGDAETAVASPAEGSSRVQFNDKHDHAFTFVNIEYERVLMCSGRRTASGNVNRGDMHLRNVDLNLLLVLYALLGEVYAISQEWVRRTLHTCSCIPYQFVEQTSLVLVYVTSELSELLFAPGLKQ